MKNGKTASPRAVGERVPASTKGKAVRGTSVAESNIPGAGHGLFAAKRFGKGALVGRMEGPRAYRDGEHVLWVWEEDGSIRGVRVENNLRFINHSRRPNVEFDGDEVITLRPIREGEEITAHYGDDWDDVD